MNENPYAPPTAPLLSPEEANSKPSAARRFLLTNAVSFPAFLLILVLAPNTNWSTSLIGALVFSLASGVIALCIPVRHKALFILPAFFATLVLAVLFGTYYRP